ncbi:hypothetical protein AB0D86_43825 [Streptomyces sp. NPDC048324]|uniref:hypothetical protein n=1 Tax=Streptomyces sp. NPDC048324 TaxID=3157205 RepID=UPI00343F2EA0
MTEYEQTHVVDWVETITAQARSATTRVFSASVPVGRPATALEAHEELLARVVESVEREGWRLDTVSTYGSGGSAYELPGYWALLVFRTAYEGRV